MALVVPLRIFRPQPQYVRDVASPPYDVLNHAEAVRMSAARPLSFLRVEKSEVDLPDTVAMTDNRVFEAARNNLQSLIRERILIGEEKPCFYIYSQQMHDHLQYGIVAGISIDDYRSGRIKKHEQTRADKEAERIQHIAVTRAQTGLVFVAYRGRPDIDARVAAAIRERPLYDFTTDDGIVHRVWILRDDRDVTFLKEAFGKVETLYIADGHHRAAAAAAVGEMMSKRNPSERGDGPCHYMMATLFPDDQLRILDYNRVVRDLKGMQKDDFLRRIASNFRVIPAFKEKKPYRNHMFGMYLSGQWYRLEAKEEIWNSNDPVRGLDVAILQEHLLEPVLGIHDPRTDQRIDFVGGARGMEALEKMVDSGAYSVSFSLYPTTLSQLMAVADAGLMMPPKSTWFEPKLRSGIFVHLLES